MRERLRAIWTDLKDDLLGAAAWDITKGVAKWIGRIILLIVVALFGEKALEQGKDILGGFLLGLAALAFLEVALALVVSAWRQRRGASLPTPSARGESAESPAAAAAVELSDTAAEPNVPEEYLERLRELYGQCRPAPAFAYEYLTVDICYNGRKGSKAHNVIANLLDKYVRPHCVQTQQQLDRQIEAQQLTKTQFDSLLALFRDQLLNYLEAAAWIVEVGPLIVGDTFLSSDGYAELHRRHKRCLEAVRDSRSRHAFRSATEFLVEYLQQLLPDPTEDSVASSRPLPAALPAAPAEESPADRESFEQFRVYFSFCKPAVQLAINFLATICATDAPAGELGRAHRVLAEGARDILSEAQDALDQLSAQIHESRAVPSETIFQVLQSQVRALIRTHYFNLAKWISLSGEVFGEDRVLSQEGYALLHRYHDMLSTEARRHRDRLDWGQIVPSSEQLKENFPDPSSRFERWGRRRPVNMTAQEIVRHVRSGFREEVIGKQWGAKITLAAPPQEGGQCLRLKGTLKGGDYTIYAEVERLGPNEEAQLSLAKAATVSGVLKDVDAQTAAITLSPANVVSWETP